MKPQPLILNRDGSLPKDHWYQIECNGIFSAGTFADGRPRKQLIDEKALTSIVNRFNAERAAAGDAWSGMLVDADHLSHDLKNPTEALAWVQELAIKNGLLHARVDPTDVGEAAIRNKRYKFFSTEYDPEDLEDLGDGTVRPLRLAGLAFTNRPNNTGARPISNRNGTTPGGETKPKTETTPTMKSIAEKLGLSAEATEADILQKITDIMSEMETLKAKQAEGEAEGVMNRFGARIPEASRPAWKAALITNRAVTEKLMETSFPEATQKAGEKNATIFNRETSKAPTPVESAQNTANKEAEVKAAAIRNRAGEISAKEGLPFNQAFNRAAAELA